jgi:hypothetical protein
LVTSIVRFRETAVSRLKPHDPRLNWREFGASQARVVEGFIARRMEVLGESRLAARDAARLRQFGAALGRGKSALLGQRSVRAVSR